MNDDNGNRYVRWKDWTMQLNQQIMNAVKLAISESIQPITIKIADVCKDLEKTKAEVQIIKENQLKTEVMLTPFKKALPHITKTLDIIFRVIVLWGVYRLNPDFVDKVLVSWWKQ